jgi:hypothetical protein
MNIGSFEIDIDSEFEMIKNKVFLNSDYIDYLVTGSGIDEILFLEIGYKWQSCK